MRIMHTTRVSIEFYELSYIILLARINNINKKYYRILSAVCYLLYISMPTITGNSYPYYYY